METVKFTTGMGMLPSKKHLILKCCTLYSWSLLLTINLLHFIASRIPTWATKYHIWASNCISRETCAFWYAEIWLASRGGGMAMGKFHVACVLLSLSQQMELHLFFESKCQSTAVWHQYKDKFKLHCHTECACVQQTLIEQGEVEKKATFYFNAYIGHEIGCSLKTTEKTHNVLIPYGSKCLQSIQVILWAFE